MAIPHVFHQVQAQDFTLTPITVHKKFVIRKNTDLYSGSLPITGSGYKIWEARYIGEKLKISSSLYATNSWDGSNQHIIWNLIDSQYYRFPYNRYSTFEHSNKRFTFKFLNYSASIIVVPQLDFGEGILPGSVEYTASSGETVRDDGNGNLYTTSVDTGSMDQRGLIAHWTFINQFRGLKKEGGYFNSDIKEIKFNSNEFEPDRSSIGKNVKFTPRYDIGAGYDTGFNAVFSGSAYILTPHRNEFNFTKNDDFSICFWIYINNTSKTGSIISKNGVLEKRTYGIQDKYNLNDAIVSVPHVSSSIVESNINVYPYDIELHGSSSIYFKRSDGINRVSLSLPGTNDIWNHVCFVKSGSSISGYVDGTLIDSVTDNLGDCNNEHSILFGAQNRLFNNGLTGSLDEIRIYNRGLTVEQISTLSKNLDQGLYQTAIIGNAFYKKGILVFGGIDPSFADELALGDFTLKFQGTHTIYQYECLVRIPKGSFNLSQNPTILQNPYSDLIINEMTGSLSEGALFPYATGIGLYNDKKELMASVKLSQPLQMRDDVDMNISIRWDG